MTPEEIARKIVRTWWQAPDISEELRDDLDDYAPTLIAAIAAALAASEQRVRELERLQTANELRVHAFNATSAKLESSERALERYRGTLVTIAQSPCLASLRSSMDTECRNICITCIARAALASPGSPQE